MDDDNGTANPDEQPDEQTDSNRDGKPEHAEQEPDKDGDAEKLGDAGKRALDAMKRERNAARKDRQQLLDKLKEYEDRDKSESQRLQEAADEAKTRAARAESNAAKLQMALDRAPEGASLAHIKAVAKRISGETEEELEADCDELFGLFAPHQESIKKEPPGKPRERLSGGGDPDDEPEEMDPRKLADSIGRH
ncbi:hypothetical protein [Amycolatopsis dendrobii]|uniref:DUF4355 domain-containing protein n=1 Tax=Amycolatopsis dendrobii TaxID=2760662 RepID=A0A7W3VV03_9PSEU|nr:hypothetical protein [Amycolatopsis dendrobii]MBB1153514.1 hypothetical protein [Amycolatopsis dendrobii]